MTRRPEAMPRCGGVSTRVTPSGKHQSCEEESGCDGSPEERSESQAVGLLLRLQCWSSHTQCSASVPESGRSGLGRSWCGCWAWVAEHSVEHRDRRHRRRRRRPLLGRGDTRSRGRHCGLAGNRGVASIAGRPGHRTQRPLSGAWRPRRTR